MQLWKEYSMKIKSFLIANFKSIGSRGINIDFTDNIVVLIGENNVGKSSIIQAMDFFFSGTKTIPTKYFHNFNTSESDAISIEICFNELTENDKQHQAIASYVSDDSEGNSYWLLRKKYYYTNDGKAKCDYTAVVNGEDKNHPSGLTQNCDDLFTNEKMQKIFVPAVQDISEIVDGKKKTPFAQIFQLLLQEELQETPEYNELLGSLQAYSQLFSGDTKHPKVTEVEELISTKLRRIIDAEGLIDVELPDSDKILPIPTLSTDDNRSMQIAPEDQGHGLQRSLIFSLLEIYAEIISSPNKDVGVTNLLLIEEPEIYMHPQMQRKIANVLYELSQSGHVQVICSTHSAIMIRLAEKQKSLVRAVQNTEGDLEVIQAVEEIFNTDPDAKRKALRMIMDFDTYVKELFFAKKIVLVEGDTEFTIFPEAARLLGLFESAGTRISKNDITVINCRSRNNIPVFQEVLNYFQIDYIVIHDLEGESSTDGKNGEILRLLNGDESRRKYFDPTIEDILGLTGGSRKWLQALNKVIELNSVDKLDSVLGEYVRFIYQS